MRVKTHFAAYCGMSFWKNTYELPEDGLDLARTIAAKIRRHEEQGGTISHSGGLDDGELWIEFESPEDAGMVADSDGILIVREVKPSAYCDHCGEGIYHGESTWNHIDCPEETFCSGNCADMRAESGDWADMV